MTVDVRISEELQINMNLTLAWQNKSFAGFYIKSIDWTLWESFIAELEGKAAKVDDFKKAA
jgi:hypothetical protein